MSKKVKESKIDENEVVKTSSAGFKRKKAVTLNTKKVGINETIFIKFESEISTKEKQNVKEGEAKEIDVATILDLDTGELMNLVIPAVLKSELQNSYSKVTGLAFEITKHGKKEGKRYNSYTIYEIDA